MKSAFLTNADVQSTVTMVNYVQLSANAIVMKKQKFAVQPEKIQTVAPSNQPVNQKEKTCLTKSVQVSV